MNENQPYLSWLIYSLSCVGWFSKNLSLFNILLSIYIYRKMLNKSYLLLKWLTHHYNHEKTMIFRFISLLLDPQPMKINHVHDNYLIFIVVTIIATSMYCNPSWWNPNYLFKSEQETHLGSVLLPCSYFIA